MMIHSHDRIRENTAPEINQRLDHAARTRIERYASLSMVKLTRRIEELDRVMGYRTSARTECVCPRLFRRVLERHTE